VLDHQLLSHALSDFAEI